MNFDLTKARALAHKNKGKASNQQNRSNVLSKTVCYKIVEKVAEAIGAPDSEIALVLIAGLAQIGGANKSALGTAVFHAEGYSLTAKTLLNVIATISRGSTIRQLCRGLSEEIITIARELELEGDLAVQMKLTYPTLTLEETVWCSNFQSQNPECPELVRDWLIKNRQERFRN